MGSAKVSQFRFSKDILRCKAPAEDSPFTALGMSALVKMLPLALFIPLVLQSLAVAMENNTDARMGVVSEPVKQQLRCQPDPPFCPEFISQKQWDQQTDKCCGYESGLTFHAQRKGDKCGIQACLFAITCQAGEIPIIYEYHKDKDRYAYIKCEPCPDKSTFEPSPRESYKYRDPTCPNRHQQCRESQGKIMIRAGNATHDTRCRCWWEKGFAPWTKTPPCLSSEGFDGDVCECYYACSDHMQLNQDFECVPKPTTTEDKKSTAKEMGQTAKTSETTRRTPMKEAEPEDSLEPQESGEKDILRTIYLMTVMLALFIIGMFLMCAFHP